MLGTVLDPTMTRDDALPEPGPDAGPLAGKTIGIRIDTLWRSWDWVSTEWAKRFEEAGATVKFWRAHQGRSGAEGMRLAAELEDFVKTIDIAVVGLANCGSCTSWTVHDSLAAARAGLPTTAVCTANFEVLAKALARRGGRSGLRLQVLPYPLDILPQGDVEAIARRHFEPMLETMGARLTVKDKVHG